MIIKTKPLETDRLFLKRGIEEDYCKVYEYDFRKLRDINNEFELVKHDLSQIADFVLESDDNLDMADWIIYLKDMAPIGNIIADRIVEDINAIEISFNLHPDFWGNGYMKEACVAVMEYLFSLGFDNILCRYSEGNIKATIPSVITCLIHLNPHNAPIMIIPVTTALTFNISISTTLNNSVN